MEKGIIFGAVKKLAPAEAGTFIEMFELIENVFVGILDAEAREIRKQADANASKIVTLFQRIETEKQQMKKFVLGLEEQLKDMSADTKEFRRLSKLKLKAEKEYDKTVEQAKLKMAERIKEQEAINAKMIMLMKKAAQKKRIHSDKMQKKHFEKKKNELDDFVNELKADSDAKFNKSMSELKSVSELQKMIDEQRKLIESKHSFIPATPVYDYVPSNSGVNSTNLIA